MYIFLRKKVYKKRKTISFSRKKRRRFKKLKKHAEKFFNSRVKKFLYYYKKRMKTCLSMENKIIKNQLHLNYKFGIQGLQKKYVRIYSMISLIKILKIYRRIIKIDKELAFRVCSYPDFLLTTKPKSVRMGKGKAPTSYAINIFTKGNIFVE
jgi:ribosomal protein L16/L10AE